MYLEIAKMNGTAISSSIQCRVYMGEGDTPDRVWFSRLFGLNEVQILLQSNLSLWTLTLLNGHLSTTDSSNDMDTN